MLVRIFPSKLQPHGVTQIGKNGLDHHVRDGQEEDIHNGPGSNLINTISV